MSNHNPPQHRFASATTMGREATRALAITVDTVKIRLGLIEAGPYTLLRLATRDSLYRLQGRCPACGQTCWSRRFSDLAGLSEQLASFRPGPVHAATCSNYQRYHGHAPRLARRCQLDKQERTC